ncbi:hypothetical protein Sjap_023916 [Stephania japonica]|uniref:Uncharacterized protein n=1 Tax=Stephania japonica TaxID=461633 RepID=A0AAP0ECM3_9MAGN
MESLPSVSPSIAIHQTNSLHQSHARRLGYPSSSPNRNRICTTLCSLSDRRPLFSESNCGISRRWKARESTSSSCGATRRGGDAESEKREEEEEEEDLERALHLDGSIPGSSDEFVKQVSSRAYDMRRHLHQTFDTSSYDEIIGSRRSVAGGPIGDNMPQVKKINMVSELTIRLGPGEMTPWIDFVLETNPWREDSKPVYVLTQRENQLCTMKTRRNRSEVERELGLLFPKGGNWRPEFGKKKQLRSGTKFRMVVEDVREGVLVFEDENEAARYCDLLQGGGQGCEGVAELEASSVFDICRKMRALASLSRRSTTPPPGQGLKLCTARRVPSLDIVYHL